MLNNKSIHFLLFASLSYLLFSCSNSFNPQNYVERGSRNVYQVGHPEFYISAFGFYDQDSTPQIQVFLDLTYNSLVFKELKEEQIASANAYIDVIRIDKNQGKVVSDNFQILIDGNQNSSQSSRFYNVTKQYELGPGLYEIEVTITDRNSNNSTTVTTQTFIPSQKGISPHITNIQLYGLDKEIKSRYKPITTYDIQSKYDSLKFIYQITNSNKDSGLTIQSNLIKFESDTLPARSMGNSNYSSSSIEYKGIDYNEERTLQSNRRVLQENGSVSIEYRFALKERGNYRFQVYIEDSNSEDRQITATRDFSIKSENYPELKTPTELARPLYYLMSKNEYQALLDQDSEQAIKYEIDRFWLRNIGDKNIARQVIELFYTRVETANKLYSNFKEGWKTDQGMMYILFGPPLYKNKSLNSLQWFYSYNRKNLRKTFYFERPKSVNEYFPFNNYLLKRDFFYHNVEYKQRRLWLKGLILTHPI